jgi:hypothetical protein
MPATLNAIERLNGRLTGVTTGLISFWRSLLPLADISLRSGEAFRRCPIHNFPYEDRKTMKSPAAIATKQMDREFAFVETTDGTHLRHVSHLRHTAMNSLCGSVGILIVSGTIVTACRWTPQCLSSLSPSSPGIRERSLSSLTSAGHIVPGTSTFNAISII